MCQSMMGTQMRSAFPKHYLHVWKTCLSQRGNTQDQKTLSGWALIFDHLWVIFDRSAHDVCSRLADMDRWVGLWTGNQNQNQYSFIVPQTRRFVYHSSQKTEYYKKDNNNSKKITNIIKKEIEIVFGTKRGDFERNLVAVMHEEKRRRSSSRKTIITPCWTCQLLSSDLFVDVSWSSDCCSWSVHIHATSFVSVQQGYCKVFVTVLSLLSYFIPACRSAFLHNLLFLHTFAASPSSAQVLSALPFLSAPSLLYSFSYSLPSPVFLCLTPPAPPPLISLACM